MKFRHYIGWAACTLMLAACQDDMLEGQLQQQGNYIYTLSGRMDGDGVMSRAQIQLGNEDVDKEHFFWNNGDSISLYQTTEDGIRESVFQISGEYNEAGEGDKHSADFSATIPALAGFKYVATYPSGLMDEESGNLVFEIKKELDFTNATTDEAKAKVWSEYLQRNMFMMAKGELKAGTSNTVGFEHLCSMLRVTYTNETEDVQSLDDICFNGNSGAFRLYYRGFYSFKGGEDGTGLYRNNVFSTWHHIKTTGLKVAPHSSTDFYVLLMPHAFPEDAELNIRFNRDSENEKSVWMPVSKIAVANDSIYAFEAGKRYWFRVTELPDGLEWDKEVEAAVMESSIALNKSMVEAQQDPHAAERIAIYNWASAAGISGENSSFLGVGRYSDSYNTSYHDSYLSSWIINAEKAISAADYVVANFPNGHAKDFNRNVLSFARIWRAVMIAEYSDNFGPCPLGGFQDDAPAYNSVQEVYYHILDELKEAVEEITPIVPTEEEAALDPMFGFNDQKWIRYANSLRLRYAMRLSEVDPDKAREEIEGVNKGMLIAGMPDIARVEERNQWNAWAGIYSREWNNISLSSIMANILTGLGGVAVTEQRPDLAPYTKPMDYMGMRFVNHYASCTDNPTKSFWLDGIPENLDPRALRLYCLPNDQSADNFIDYGSVANHANYGMYDTNGTDNILYPIDAQYTWNYYPYGSRNAWSFNFSFNVVSKAYPYVLPVLSRTFGGRSEGARVWFGPWETHFILAEAALYGWNVGTTAEAAYEQGIRSSFEYFGVSKYVDAYLQSEDYNRVGTSVKFSHTAEPRDMTVNYTDGYTKDAQTMTYVYPDPTKALYQGRKLNDKLSKIITQKYIAQAPYGSLEMWNDRRRLGLPWFDMPNNDTNFKGTDMDNTWTPRTYLTGQTISVFPQRLRYPSGLKNLNGALQVLGGENTTLTPLWWANKQGGIVEPENGSGTGLDFGIVEF